MDMTVLQQIGQVAGIQTCDFPGSPAPDSRHETPRPNGFPRSAIKLTFPEYPGQHPCAIPEMLVFNISKMEKESIAIFNAAQAAV